MDLCCPCEADFDWVPVDTCLDSSTDLYCPSEENFDWALSNWEVKKVEGVKKSGPLKDALEIRFSRALSNKRRRSEARIVTSLTREQLPNTFLPVLPCMQEKEGEEERGRGRVQLAKTGGERVEDGWPSAKTRRGRGGGGLADLVSRRCYGMASSSPNKNETSTGWATLEWKS
ncbi:hypothetical protein QJS10_CPA01g02254 [Acorus calamus]|uniref:Uncharacterized protein n=1 Tax=Acorus calamus TaxID=4465 RepID=A0AAV9FJI0_ACOCL|nr:hypothetical protein QJS10_CPA01g02254 [Acorus calamus]